MEKRGVAGAWYSALPLLPSGPLISIMSLWVLNSSASFWLQETLQVQRGRQFIKLLFVIIFIVVIESRLDLRDMHIFLSTEAEEKISLGFCNLENGIQ